MAQTPCKYEGEGRFIEYTPFVDIPAGTVIKLVNVIAIAPRFIAADTPGVLDTGGVWKCPKNGSDFAPGEPCFWHDAGDPIDGDPNSGAMQGTSGEESVLAGFCTEYTAPGAAYVFVCLVKGAGIFEARSHGSLGSLGI